MSNVTESMVMGMFELVSADNGDIYKDARGYGTDRAAAESYVSWQKWKGAAVGAAAGAIPVASYLTIPADVAYALRLMHRAAAGVCAIRLGEANEDTFAGVLGTWTGEIELDGDFSHQVIGKVAAKASVVGGPIGVKLAIKGVTEAAGLLVAKKIAPKVAIVVAARIGAKLSSKVATRWIPVMSAIASGGVNAWIIDNVAESAHLYCNFVTRTAECSTPTPPSPPKHGGLLAST